MEVHGARADRPTFELDVPCTPTRALALLRERVENLGAECQGQFFPGHAVLAIPSERQHFWSPQLTLDLEPRPDGTRVHGTFGPRPAVWTLFVFCYCLLGFAGLMGFVFGFSQWSLGADAPALWSVPLAAGLTGMVYATAMVGQRLGRSQMVQLRAFVEAALIEAFAEV